MRKTRVLLVLLSTLTIPMFSAVVYDESISGSLSSSGLAPTVIALSAGSNQILGTNGSGAPAVRDYVTFTVPVGLTLNSITLLDTAIGSIGFLGIQAGNQLTLPPTTTTAAGLLGWWHYTPSNKNSDLLALAAVPANGSSGFTLPLPAGSYTLWTQDSSPGVFHYGLDIRLQAIPEPATWTSSLVGFLAVAGLFSLRRQRS